VLLARANDGDSYSPYQFFICVMSQQGRTVAGTAYFFEPEASMAIFGKSALLSLGVLASVAFAAQAQTSGLASLPPNPAAAPPAAASPVAPSATMPGPNPGTASNAGMGATQTAIAPSPTYVGPSPGAGTGNMPPRFEKAADWDANTALHPYTSSMGPRPN
jgi:hypothetical protein